MSLPALDEPDAAPPLRRPRDRRRRRSPWIAIVASVAVIAAAAVVTAPWDPQRRQAIEDQFVVWTNPPPAEIEAIAEATALTEEGRRILFASLPEIEDAESFNEHCGVEDATVLGCYAAERIYVFAVSDERLGGTVEVTAAHEMLHAAYERLSLAERREVDELVAAFVESLPDDDPVRAVVDTYAVRQHADEWHSRLGTEFADLGPELEAHFARYFVDRSAVVALRERSTAALRELEAEIDDLVAQIDALGADLEARGSAYDADVAALNADIDAFNARADAGDFSSQAQFDVERAELVARSDDLEAARVALNADVERYNGLVTTLEDLDARYADLYSSLDSKRDTADVE